MVKSNKIFKILTIMLIAILLVTAFSGIVNAEEAGTGTGTGININTYTSSISPTNPGGGAESKITGVAGNVLYILQAIGMVAGIAVLAFMGIKYITSSPDGKAEVKKQAFIYLGGAALLMLAPWVAQLVFNAVSK